MTSYHVSTSQVPASGEPHAMDAELKSLRIDRSRKANKPSGKTFRWILIGLGLIALLAVAWFVYAKLNAAVEVETVRVRAASTSSGPGAGETILSATGYIIAAHKIQ